LMSGCLPSNSRSPIRNAEFGETIVTRINRPLFICRCEAVLFCRSNLLLSGRLLRAGSRYGRENHSPYSTNSPPLDYISSNSATRTDQV
jgi:hypothetical protein